MPKVVCNGQWNSLFRMNMQHSSFSSFLRLKRLQHFQMSSFVLKYKDWQTAHTILFLTWSSTLLVMMTIMMIMRTSRTQVEVASRLVRIVIELVLVVFVMEPKPQCHRWLRLGTISDFTLIKSRRRYSMRLRNFKRRRLPIRSCWGGEEEVNYFGPRGKLYFRPNLDQHLDEEGGCLLFWWLNCVQNLHAVSSEVGKLAW